MGRKDKVKIDFELRGFKYKNIPAYQWGRDDGYTLSTSGTAAMAKQYLQSKYPDALFFIKSRSFAGGDSIDVYGIKIPEDSLKTIEAYVDSLMNSQSDYSGDYRDYKDLEEIKTADGKKVSYGAKYTFFYNSAPWFNQKYNSEPLTVPSTKTESEVPTATIEDIREGKIDYNHNNPFVIAKLSTGWDLWIQPQKPLHEQHIFDSLWRVFLKLDYSVATPLAKDSWFDLKTIMESRNIIWNRKEKSLDLIKPNGQSKELSYQLGYAIEQILGSDKDGVFHWIDLDNLFVAIGYKPVRKNEPDYILSANQKSIDFNSQHFNPDAPGENRFFIKPDVAIIDEKELPEVSDNEIEKYKGKIAPLKYIYIYWHEGTDNYGRTLYYKWDDFAKVLNNIYAEHQGDGYTKCKVRIVWANGKYIDDRIDIGNNEGDFNPNIEAIESYLKNQKTSTYKSTLEDGDRLKSVSWHESIVQDEESNDSEDLLPAVIETQEKTDELSPVQSITIGFHEGVNLGLTGKTFNTWKEFESALRKIFDADQYKDDGGYTKVDATITWENGKVLKTRVDVGISAFNTLSDNPNLLSIGDYIKKGLFYRREKLNIDNNYTDVSWNDKEVINVAKESVAIPEVVEEIKVDTAIDSSILLKNLKVLYRHSKTDELKKLIEGLKVINQYN